MNSISQTKISKTVITSQKPAVMRTYFFFVFLFFFFDCTKFGFFDQTTLLSFYAYFIFLN